MRKIIVIIIALLMFVTALLAWQEHHDEIHDNVPRCFADDEVHAITKKDLHIPFTPTGDLKRGSLMFMDGCHKLFRVKMGKSNN